MLSRPRILGGTLVAALCATALILLVSSAAPNQRRGGTDARPGELLPDLDPVAPYDLAVAGVGPPEDRRWRLGFASAAENVGAGPLIVNGWRRGASAPTMSADQVTLHRDGSRFTNPDVGRLRFVTSPDHRHWHYLRFMRYELRAGTGYRLVRPDRKSGFCLGDRYDPGRNERRKPSESVFTGNCSESPDAFAVREGISVGYGDDYKAHLEGQYVDVTGLPAGRYQLVHRVNESRRLRERSFANNSSSLLIRLRWPGGANDAPQVRRIAACPRSDRCRRRR